MCSLIVSGTPAAVVEPSTLPPKLLRISLRTTPLCVSTLTMPPLLLLVPSAGDGPPVSSGLTEQLASLVPVPVVPVPVVLVAVVVVAAAVVRVSDELPPQPRMGSEAAPP